MKLTEGTAISAGTLQVGNGGNGRQLTKLYQGQVNVNGGVLAVAGNNSYSGGTTVSGGTLIAGGGNVNLTNANAMGTLAVSGGTVNLGGNALGSAADFNPNWITCNNLETDVNGFQSNPINVHDDITAGSITKLGNGAIAR